jgi:hypothetical protein
MDGSFGGPSPQRKPLLGADGQWDRVALAAWFQDDACWKAVMPDDDLAFLGLRPGDLLITDDAVNPVPGVLILSVDEMLCSSSVGEAVLDGAGRLCVDIEGKLMPIEGDDAPHGLVLVAVGFVPMQGDERPTLKDLLRAQVLPGFNDPPGPRGIRVEPDDLPY